MNFQRYIVSLSIAVCALLSIAACSRTFAIKPSGQLGGAVIFSLYDYVPSSGFKLTPVALPVTYLYVLEKVNAGSKPAVVWEIRGSEKLQHIEYGRKYRGFDVLVPAKPLSSKSEYVVRAFARDRSGGITGFLFDSAGNVVED